MRTISLALFAVLGACGTDDDPGNVISNTSDKDGDGQSPTQGDCDDNNPDVFLGADEYCNGIDDDCDTEIDEKGAVDSVVWYFDDDEDGYGWAESARRDCYQPDGFVDNKDDCDDDDSNALPGGTESCDDGIDNDCNGLEDCEEAACSDLHICDEVSCTNKIDDDDDGLVDCDDDACWGMPACAEEVVTMVNAGKATAYVRDVVADGGNYNAFHRYTGWLYVSAVTGTVQARFTDHTATCTWALSGASIAGAQRMTSGGIGVSPIYAPVDANRGSVMVDGDDCAYWGTSVLPPDSSWFIGHRQFRSSGGGNQDALIGERVTSWDSFDLPTRIAPFYVGSITSEDLTFTSQGTFSSGTVATWVYGWFYADLKPWAPYTFTP